MRKEKRKKGKGTRWRCGKGAKRGRRRKTGRKEEKKRRRKVE